ncbi:MAG: DUF427 domain-containing protein [Streptosporangiaceae bacterium]
MTKAHTITIVPAQTHVQVKVGGQTVAESDRAMRLDETGLSPRYYFPADDVRTDLLRPTELRTTCPFKGEASYWSVQAGDDLHENVVWSYQDPIKNAEAITGLFCFYDEKVDQAVSSS